MPVAPPPPPPPPPPPAAIQAPIPKSNKQLLQSIEKGAKLKKVPESLKNDRSSGLAAAGIAKTGNSTNGSGQSRPQGQTATTKSTMGNGPMDFQSQLKNQLSSMNSAGSGNQERRSSITKNTHVSVRPASTNKPDNKPCPVTMKPEPVFPAGNMTQNAPSYGKKVPAAANGSKYSTNVNSIQASRAPPPETQTQAIIKKAPFIPTSNRAPPVVSSVTSLSKPCITTNQSQSAQLRSHATTNPNQVVMNKFPLQKNYPHPQSERQSTNVTSPFQSSNHMAVTSAQPQSNNTSQSSYRLSQSNNSLPSNTSHSSHSMAPPPLPNPYQSNQKRVDPPPNPYQSNQNRVAPPTNLSQSAINRAPVSINPPQPSVITGAPYSPPNWPQSSTPKSPPPKFNQNVYSQQSQPQSITNNRAPQPPIQVQSNSSRAPPPNQPQSSNTRAPPPPPPPANSKPTLGHNEPVIAAQTSAPYFSEPTQRLHNASSTTTQSFPRTADSTYTPMTNPVTTTRPALYRPTSSGPPPPPPASRSSNEQSSSTSISNNRSVTSAPYKITDRAPPPPPPPLGPPRSRNTAPKSAFDRQFTFPEEASFPVL